MSRYPKRLTPEARIAAKAYLRANRLEGHSRTEATALAAQESGLSPSYIDSLLLPAPVVKKVEGDLLREIWETRTAPAAPADMAPDPALLVEIAAKVEEAVRAKLNQYFPPLVGVPVAVRREGAEVAVLLKRDDEPLVWHDAMKALI